MENSGISFGIDVPGVLVVSGLMWLLLALLVVKNRYWGGWLILIGGGWNWWERWQTGVVTDYWKVPGLPLYNNLNDWLIFFGLIAVVFQMIWHRK